MISEFFIISAADGSPARKIYCPIDEIENQLSPGETFEVADPLVAGFGIVELEE